MRQIGRKSFKNRFGQVGSVARSPMEFGGFNEFKRAMEKQDLKSIVDVAVKGDEFELSEPRGACQRGCQTPQLS